MDVKDIAVVCSALVGIATISFAIYSNRRNRSGKFKVKAHFVDAFETADSPTPLRKEVSVAVTSIGIDARYIELVGVRIDSPGQLSRYMQLHLLDRLKDFPKKLERGEQYQFSVPLEAMFGNPFLIGDGLKKGDSFRVFVRDTLGNNYLSEKLDYRG